MEVVIFMKKTEHNYFKTLIFILVVTSIFIFTCFFTFKDKNKETKTIFLNHYGDIKIVESVENVMSLGLIVYNFNNDYKDTNIKSHSLRFDNEYIEILDYDFVDANLRFKDAKLFYLNITYKMNEYKHYNIDDSIFEVNNIYIQDDIFNIGNLFFFPVANNYNENEELYIESVSAMSSGIGLKPFYANLVNNTSKSIIIRDIDLKHFNDFKPKLNLGNNNITKEDISINNIEIKEDSSTLLSIDFNHAPNDKYDVFYFTPVLEYLDSKNESKNLFFDYFVSGLMLDKKELKIIIDKYKELNTSTLANISIH